MTASPTTIAAQTAWGEARGEGAQGMQAVLNVIANRVADPGWWGYDVIDVCLMGHGATHQFSCWNASDPNRARISTVTATDPQYAIALRLAEQMIAGTLDDITHGADSYYALGTQRPSWAIMQRQTATIGHQAFYRVGAHGDASYVRNSAGVLV